MRIGRVVIAIGIVLFVGVMFTIIVTIGIWPGEAKLLKGWLCSSEQPDAYVVTDTYQSEPGETSTNFTMYCVGPRGDYTDQGWGKPMFILIGLHTAILVGLFILLSLLAAFRRSRRAVGGPDGPPDLDAELDADEPEPVVAEADEGPSGPIIS